MTKNHISLAGFYTSVHRFAVPRIFCCISEFRYVFSVSLRSKTCPVTFCGTAIDENNTAHMFCFMLKEHAMFMSLHPVNNSGVTGTGLCVGVRESWGDASIGYITTLMTQHFGVTVFTPQINQTNYFIVRLKVDQRAGQFSLPHLGITQTEKIELKHKNDEQISPVNGLEP